MPDGNLALAIAEIRKYLLSGYAMLKYGGNLIKLPPELWEKYDKHLEAEKVPLGQRADFRKWLRYYLDFCR